MALGYFKNKEKIEKEELLRSVKFNVYKFNHRPRPKKKDRIKIVGCFSEFGCETLGTMYCLPRLLRRFPGSYVIGMGWYGREYMYRHLLDEFWEIDDEHMHLKDYSRAFHFNSKNLSKIEEVVSQYGTVVPSSVIGKYAVSNFCKTCGMFWNEWRKRSDYCPKCESTVIVRSIFTDIEESKKVACPTPRPSKDMMDWAKTIVKPNTVGIFARGRKTYGRNLQPEFYVKLIDQLRSSGYNVIWLGEKQSTLPCPVDDVIDFSRMHESRDLERTLAIVCNLEFTVQFWTASTRIASMVGIPFLLFESPEQICVSYSGLGSAQEGKRLELMNFNNNKKVVLAHYKSVYEDHDTALDLVKRSIDEMNEGDYNQIVGMVGDKEFVHKLEREHMEMLT